ncbi:MAG: PKD domain-containing protein [Bacteroidota bacterium]
MKNSLLLTLVFLVMVTSLPGQVRRYTESISATSTIDPDIVYGQALFLNGNGSNETNASLDDLVLDIYEPTGDGHQLRPAIIFAHSGAFFNGNRNHDDMVALCDTFARRGYVTATIDYRKGFWFLTNAALHATRAVYRGIQDGRSAVRYFRANAAALGVDPDHIYLAGSSAGGFIALHSIYLTELSERPPEVGAVPYVDIFTTRTTPDLGPPDVGSNVGFSGTPNGIVNLWGAVEGLDLIDPTDNQPVFLAHGTADATIPFLNGPPFGFTGFPDVFGSSLIKDQLDLNGSTNYETYFVPGGPHEFYGTDNGNWSDGIGPNLFWDTLLNRITHFLWEQHKPTADFSVVVNGLTADFTDTSTDAQMWSWDFGDGATSTDANPSHTYATAGTYPVKLFIQNDLLSWDTLEQMVTVEAILPLTWIQPLRATHDGKDVHLTWRVREQVNTRSFIIEHATGDEPFTDLGQITAAGTLAEAIAYNFLHEQPPFGQHYYRIRQEDLDGGSSYSTLATVRVGEKLQVYPNPTMGIVKLWGLQDGTHTFDVLDLAGRRVGQQRLTSDAELNLSFLPPGTYWLRPAGGQQVLKLVKR